MHIIGVGELSNIFGGYYVLPISLFKSCLVF